MRRRQGDVAVLDVYNVVLGVFLVLSPWLFAYAREPARLDAWTAGIAVTATSLAALLIFAEWEEWVRLLVGLWIIASPWLLGFAHTRAMHVAIVAGAVITYLSLLELWLIHYSQEYRLRS